MHVGLSNLQCGPHAIWRPLPVGSILIHEGFWKKRQVVNRTSSLQHAYRWLERYGNFPDLRMAAGRMKGQYIGKVFMDSDVYKWLEAIAYELFREQDVELQRMADEAIELIGAAQAEDGYIDSYYQVAEPDRRWTDLTRGHEMYCAGHLMEAAIAFNRFLGDRRLLDIALRFADHIDSVFGPGKRAGVPGHPEVELALVELYRETGEKRYLDMARFFVDQRGLGLLDPGQHGGHGGPAVYQDHIPVREASTMEGHAVRQLYLTTGITDLFLETGERALFDALMRQWHDMAYRKMFVTGGLGSIHLNEAFSEPYELPNSRGYCETCAAIASIMWNWRLLMATADVRFADMIEHTLYNAFLSGVSMDGRHFFYVNPLLSRGANPAVSRKRIERVEWPWTPCCPPNIMRLVALLDHYVATSGEAGLQIHQYISSTIHAGLNAGRKAVLKMQTALPWQGSVRLIFDEADGLSWPLKLRIPSWCRDWEASVNGRPVDGSMLESGYLTVQQAWRKGDRVELMLKMKPFLLEAHPHVDSTWSSLAIQRGPIVYCLEQKDQDPGVDVLDVRIDETVPLKELWKEELLGGLMTVEASGYLVDRSPWENRLYRSLGSGEGVSKRPVRLTAVPYFAWAHRGPNAMRVWIPRFRAC
jgi:DUF1680 family protein